MRRSILIAACFVSWTATAWLLHTNIRDHARMSAALDAAINLRGDLRFADIGADLVFANEGDPIPPGITVLHVHPGETIAVIPDWGSPPPPSPPSSPSATEEHL